MRIYIESTIPSYLVARPATDLLQAARQQLTKQWWTFERQKHELYTSQIVLDEISFGEPAMAKLRLDALDRVPLLDVTPQAEALAERILESSLLPRSADRDAAHIALASVHSMDILITWNCRHIANAYIQSRLRQVIATTRNALPVICTPEEAMEMHHE